MNKRIEELQFFISYWDFNKKKLVTANVFEMPFIGRRVAKYVLEMTKDEPCDWALENKCLYVFSDLWSRCEWELAVSDIVSTDDWQKVDMVGLFIKPNEELIFNMIKEIKPSEAKRYLKEYK